MLAPLVAADVVEIDVHEEVGRHARCTLLVQNWDADTRAVRHSDSGPFTPGAELAVSMGFHSDLTPVFEGVIASLTAHFPRGRPAHAARRGALQVDLAWSTRRGRGNSPTSPTPTWRLRSPPTTRSPPMPTTAITRPFVVSDRVSDWDFLKARATELGWALYVRGDSLVMKPPASPSSPPQLDYTKRHR